MDTLVLREYVVYRRSFYIWKNLERKDPLHTKRFLEDNRMFWTSRKLWLKKKCNAIIPRLTSFVPLTHYNMPIAQVRAYDA